MIYDLETAREGAVDTRQIKKKPSSMATRRLIRATVLVISEDSTSGGVVSRYLDGLHRSVVETRTVAIGPEEFEGLGEMYRLLERAIAARGVRAILIFPASAFRISIRRTLAQHPRCADAYAWRLARLGEVYETLDPIASIYFCEAAGWDSAHGPIRHTLREFVDRVILTEGEEP